MLLRSWLETWRRFRNGFRDPASRRICKSAPGNSQQSIEGLESRCLLTTTSINLGNLGSAGVTLYGNDVGDESGSSVHGIGDVNGDGYDDFLIGAFNAAATGNQRPNAGESYVIFGKANWSGTQSLNLNAANLDGSDGFILSGIDVDDLSGHSVGSAGDVNGDGFDDFTIGADGSDGKGNVKVDAGETYVVFGKAKWTSTPTIELSSLNGTNGITLFGNDEGDHSGSVVSGAGDVNGDGFDDILIGAPLAAGLGNVNTDAGESYLVFGKPNWSNTPSLVLSPSNLDGTAGVTFFGVDSNDHSGSAVSGAGDVNGDGFADLIIGAYNSNGELNSRSLSGESYLVFGKANWSSTSQLTLNTTTLNGTTGVTLFGSDQNDASGRAVSSAGDVNGDGFGDLLIGAPLAGAAGNLKTYAGESYVVFGKANWSNTPTLTLNTATLNGTAGFTLFGADILDRSGSAVSSAGDVNGDGFDDIVIAAYAADGAGNVRQDAGESYVIFGKSSWKSTKTVDLGQLNGSNGFTLYDFDFGDGSDGSGIVSGNVSPAGDVNGDGFADVLVSARFADGLGNTKENSGESYLIFGKNFTGSAIKQGTKDDDTVTGTTAADRLIGGTGDDLLVGNGGADVLYGGEGDDVLAISSTNFSRIDGGGGSDTLRLDGSGLNLNLTTLPDNRLTNIETIDLRGSGSNTLVLNARDVLNIGGSSRLVPANTLAVRRDFDDIVTLGAGWTQGADVVQDGLSYQVFTNGGATVRLEKLSLINPTVTLGVDQPTIAEADGTATVTATMAEVSDVNVVVNLTFSGTATVSDDYSRSAVHISIPAGSLSGSITLTAVQDPMFEGPETIVVAILNVSHGTPGAANQVSIEIIDDDHAPELISTAVPVVEENTIAVLTVSATDADTPAQTITYSISGGGDQSLFTITSKGDLSFKSPPNFEIPADKGADNLYEVEVSADDGHGGVTVQNISVTVTDVPEVGSAELILGGGPVTFARKQPVVILPQIQVAGDSLGGGTLEISINGLGTGRKPTDSIKFPAFSDIGTSPGPEFANGQLNLTVQLKAGVTSDAVQAFLRGITLATRGIGFRTITRNVHVTLTDANLGVSSVQQTVNIRKRA
jgi:hypothetical protein